MKEKCDVVVIGAGIGGLCAAARLAYSGYKTVVLEKSTILGGRYTCVDYKGYKIPTGAWMVFYGMNDPIWRTLQDVEAPRVELADQRPLTNRYKVAGKEFLLPERGALNVILSVTSRDKAEEEKMLAMVKRAIVWQEPSDTISLRDWLLQYTDNEEIHKVFQGMAQAYFGIDSYDTPAGEFFRVLRTVATVRTPLLFKNGLKDIIDALESAIKDKGGKIYSRTAVTQIVVEEGVAKGVVAQMVKERLEVEAKVIISNAGPKKTIELAGENNFDKGYLKEVMERVRPAVGMTFIIASDQPLFDADLLTDMDSSKFKYWADFSKHFPECAPNGKHLIACFAVTPSNIEYDPQEEYKAFINEVRQRFPGFEEHGEVLLVQNFCGAWPVTRSWQGYMIAQKTPIENLYNVGDAVNPTGWIFGSGVAESARIVSEDIKTRVRL
ncbi:phytoene desaturase family protein [Chloroflexota bacterium]